MTPAEERVETLCQIMVRHGIVRLVYGDLTLERPAFAVAALMPKPEAEPDEHDPLAKLKTMTPDELDATLTLAPTRGAGF